MLFIRFVSTPLPLEVSKKGKIVTVTQKELKVTSLSPQMKRLIDMGVLEIRESL